VLYSAERLHILCGARYYYNDKIEEVRLGEALRVWSGKLKWKRTFGRS
jgi:hypothetical protein